ncbi:MAG: choice-of-anchor D domain-containing protein, partial [Gammaproteobacteria bacterium]|nr:choice-of-anchor D domain-containing protein [Gammaproteobacteria bacterium]
DASASGSFSLLGAQQTNSADLVVGLGNADTSTAGAKSGTATISLESDGTGTSNIVGNVDLGTQTVNVSGNVYRLAEGLAQEAGDNVIDFGNFLVGNTVTRNLTITNTALNDTFSEELNALFGTLTNGTPSFGTLSTNGGSVDLLGAGQSNSVNMTVSYMAAAAGSIGGSVEILFESDGTNTSGFSAISIDPDVLSIFGIIGQAGTLAIAGPATPNPVTGSIRVGDTLVEGLSISNLATAPAEGLNAYFSGTSDAAITANGTVGTPGSSPGLAPGAVSTGDLSVQVAGNAAGNISGTATLKLESDGTFNSGTITNLADQTINVDVDVFRLAEAGA